ncbi:MAG: metallophosphoesterase family protein [Bryobacteraceae bacterium]
MKALIFSDIHSDHRALEALVARDADFYFAAGDLVSWARGLDRCGEILKARADKVRVLPGNHESADQIASFCAQYGFHDFHGRTETLGGFHFAGLGYSSPTPFNTPGEYTDDEIARRLEAFAGLKPLVLVCHAPPLGTPLDRVREGVHAGSRAVRDFIEKRQPRYFFCGHIHEAEGVETRMGETFAVNAGKRGYLLEW